MRGIPGFRRAGAILAGLVLAALGARVALAEGPEDPARSPWTAEEAGAVVRQVAPAVETIRGLAFLAPVSVKIVDREAARAHALRRLKMFGGTDEIRLQERAYSLLGLVPPGADLLALLLGVIDEQAVGFYDPGSKSFFLVASAPKGIAGFIASHELTHAVEDQHFDLDARLRRAAQDDDAMFALTAVHEGSATLVMGHYAAEALASGSLKRGAFEEMARSEAGQAAALRAAPPVIRREFTAPYLLGAAFLLRGDPSLAAGAYPRDSAARSFSDPPRSSEQILHPEKYWDPARRDDPVPVDTSGAARVLPEGWRREATGTLGELVIGALVGAPTPEIGVEDLPGPEAWTCAEAAGWGGDRWELWTLGSAAVVVLATVWDTREDAFDFAMALPLRPGFSWRWSGDRVAIVAGDPADRLDSLLAAMAGW